MNVCGSVFLELVINNQTKNIMRIAYLISAYKDPHHLKRLIRALSIGVENQVKFFIHVDAKVDIAPFKKYCDYSRNIEFLDKRYLVQWGGILKSFTNLSCSRRPWRMKHEQANMTGLCL